jgi:hypothetical protein
MSNEKNDNALCTENKKTLSRAVARKCAFDVARQAVANLAKRVSTEMIAVINEADLPEQIEGIVVLGSGSKMVLKVFENEDEAHEFEIGVQRYRADNACCLDVIVGSPMEMED